MMCHLPGNQPFWGQVQIWTVTKHAVDHEGGVTDGTVLFCDISAI